MNNELLMHKNSIKSSIFWNMIGSIIASASSFILLLCVTRISGVIAAGIFSIAFSTGQILLSIGKFGVRSFQSTDIKQEFPFSIYLLSRLYYCILMMLLCIIFCFIMRYEKEKTLIFTSVCAIKMTDAIEDVFHGQLQCIGKLDVAGKLLASRNLFTILLFGIILLLSNNLLLSSSTTAIASILCALLINIPITGKYTSYSYDIKPHKTMILTRLCFPLFISTFLSLLIYNIPKYALDILGSPEQVTYYSIIFMPIFAINLLSEFIFKPIITQIAYLWENHLYKEFNKVVIRLLTGILYITVLAVILAYLIGADVLSLIYSLNILPYRSDFTMLVIAGGFGAASYLMYNILAAMRIQSKVMMSYIITLIVVSVLSLLSVKDFGIKGVSISYLLAEIILFLTMGLEIVLEIRKKQHA